MGDIKLAGATWSFVGASLRESATIWRALGGRRDQCVEVVGRLQDVGYEGYLTLEYEHEPGWMDMDKCDVLTETIKMRDTVRPLLC